LRVLFVTPVAFAHASGGGRTAAESFLEVLRAPPLGAEVEVLALQAKAARLPHRARQVVALVRSAVHALPSKSLFHVKRAAIERLRAAVTARSYDLVVINGGDLYFLARYLPAAQARLGLALNVEGDLYEQQTKSLRAARVLGRFFTRDLAKLRAVEVDGLGQLDGVVCLSSEDASRLGELRPGVRTLTLPTSFSYPPFHRDPNRAVSRPLKLGFLAKYGWWPNAEAAEWIIRRVLPGLPTGCVELHLYGPGSERFASRHPAIVAHGYVDDLSQVWAQSDIVVCPIVSGSGINIKVVEALYNGNPMLATSHAIRGLPPLADPAIVCLDTPAEWIEFLSGDRAEALARKRPRPEVSALFSTRSAPPALAAFIAQVRRGGSQLRGPGA
jgi:polysaccharide biosynthesis protein PslH